MKESCKSMSALMIPDVFAVPIIHSDISSRLFCEFIFLAYKRFMDFICVGRYFLFKVFKYAMFR